MCVPVLRQNNIKSEKKAGVKGWNRSPPYYMGGKKCNQAYTRVSVADREVLLWPHNWPRRRSFQTRGFAPCVASCELNIGLLSSLPSSLRHWQGGLQQERGKYILAGKNSLTHTESTCLVRKVAEDGGQRQP
jgi:hypothetical protein